MPKLRCPNCGRKMSAAKDRHCPNVLCPWLRCSSCQLILDTRSGRTWVAA